MAARLNLHEQSLTATSHPDTEMFAEDCADTEPSLQAQEAAVAVAEANIRAQQAKRSSVSSLDSIVPLRRSRIWTTATPCSTRRRPTSRQR
jgi:hypothetical protein